MSRFLLDVNVLIALIDSDHEFSEMAHGWFTALNHRDKWFTCPITENGVVRIMCGTGYPTGPLPISEVVDALLSLCEDEHHGFAEDSISVTDPHHFTVDHIVSSRRLTDAYLVALSAAIDAVFVTLDRRLVKSGVVAAGAEVMYLEGENARS